MLSWLSSGDGGGDVGDSGSNARVCPWGLRSWNRAGTLVDCWAPTTVTHCFEQ